MFQPIITSLLDTDLYKFTMMQCVWHQAPQTQVAYRFKCRKPIDLSIIAEELKQQLSHFCALRFQPEELAYLQTLPFFKPDFINFLADFKLNKQQVTIDSANNLTIQIQGSWVETILFEVPLLAIISEIYYRQTCSQDLTLGRTKLRQKTALLESQDVQGLRFSDFGTRRRFSKVWHAEMLNIIKEALPQQFIGTSNVYFAKMLDLNPIGTMAHEFLQAYQVLAPALQGCQKYALQVWLKEYQGALGIALTDVFTMDIFLQEFDKDLAAEYAGLRQDSGDPFLWGDKAIQHYKKLGIDPRTKIFVFSDRLTFPLAIQIYQYFKDQCQLYFGIGTNLTNDVGFDPLDIVIKMTHTNNKPVIKISDSPGKIICEDNQFLQQVNHIFHLKD